MNETEQKLREALAAMLNEGEKVSVFAVAKRAGVSNPTIHNRYPELRDEINAIKSKRETGKQQQVKGQLHQIRKQKEDKHAEVKASRRREGVVLAHLMETYRLCDELQRENDALHHRFGDKAEVFPINPG